MSYGTHGSPYCNLREWKDVHWRSNIDDQILGSSCQDALIRCSLLLNTQTLHSYFYLRRILQRWKLEAHYWRLQQTLEFQRKPLLTQESMFWQESLYLLSWEIHRSLFSLPTKSHRLLEKLSFRYYFCKVLQDLA